MRLYIAGPVSDDRQYKVHFAAAAYRLKVAGHESCNPAALTAPHVFRPGDDTWLAWMRTATQLLTECDGVALIPGWRDSRGAVVEADWAEAVGLPVKEIEEWLA